MDESGFTISPKLYDFLKWMALVLLPGLAALYAGLGSLWNFPAITEVVGSVTAVDTFLGVLLGRSSSNYARQSVVGEIVAQQDKDGLVTGYRMIANRDPLVFDEQKKAVFTVRREAHLQE